MKIAGPNIYNILSYASYKGINRESLLIYLSDPEMDFCETDSKVDSEAFLAILRDIILRTNDPHFGLHFGYFLNIRALGFISNLTLNASTMSQAVVILQDYLKHSFPVVSLHTYYRNDEYVLSLKSSIQDEQLKPHLLDIAFAFLYREIEIMIEDPSSIYLELPYRDFSEYSIFLNNTIQKGEGHSIVLPKVTESAKINNRKTEKIEVLLPQFLKLLDKQTEGYSEFSEDIRKMTLSMCTPELPTFNQVVKQFPYSKRTIQRKLTEDNLSYRKITNTIKKELAEYLRKDAELKTQDIAFTLGYSDSSAYLHALKSWQT